MAFIYTDGAMTPVTRPSAPTNLHLDKNNVAPNAEVVLSWDASVDGICNPVNRYEVYAGNELWGWSTETQLQFLAHKDVKPLDYWVKAVGKIESMSSLDSEHISLRVIITAPSVPKNVSISKADAAALSWQTVSWDASSDGTNNPVVGYEVYRNGKLIATTDETLVWVQASNVDGGIYSYTVRAIGSVTGYHSDESEAVTLTAHAETYSDYFYTYDSNKPTQSFTVPSWAERIDVCCIGGGAGGASGGYVQAGFNSNLYPDNWGGGGAAGGTGEMINTQIDEFESGAVYEIRVGAGGAAGLSGGASSFGSIVTARGGQVGGNGDPVPLKNQTTANGGVGGTGGIGGNGGDAGRGDNANLLGRVGNDGHSWHEGWEEWPSAKWYAFSDSSTGRRLGRGGAGGWGYKEYERYERGASSEEAPGTMYGGGGRGGDQQRSGINYVFTGPQAGQHGLVAVRCWRYVR